MSDRPYSQAKIEELERLVAANRAEFAILGPIRQELEFRKTRRAQQLLREVRGIVEGDVPRARMQLPDSTDNQVELPNLEGT